MNPTVRMMQLGIGFGLCCIGAVLCYKKRDGWGWFVFAGVIIAAPAAGV